MKIQSKSVFRIGLKSYKNNLGSKLTPHKYKKTRVSANSSSILSQTKLSWLDRFNFWQTQGIASNVLGFAELSSLVNCVGIRLVIPSKPGYPVNSIIKVSKLGNICLIHGLTTLPNNLTNTPITDVYTLGGKIFAKSTSARVAADAQGLTYLQLPTARIKLSYANAMLASSITSRLPTAAITSRVRGIAKNPVDHPNGGRANTKGSFKTPWGSYAKASK
jgi:hypothetical protein